VQSLPLILSVVVAALVVPPLVRALRDQGFVTTNYRGTALPFPAGMAIPVASPWCRSLSSRSSAT